MALFTWSEQFSLKIDSMDEQHKKLIDILNQFHDAMLQKKEDKKIGETLAELIAYTEFHFAEEEKLLQENGYPDLDNHKNEHDELRQKVTEFQREYVQGSQTVTDDVMFFLKDWLVNHILGVDKRYAPFLIEKGVN